MNPLIFPKGLNAASFLRDYWQQRPLLLRQGLPGLVPPVSADELAGLACEPEIESRLILEHGNSPWQLRHGPFDDEDFATLPDTHWTLLVQDVDKQVPAAQDLLDAFSFLPRWRMDDLMVSYAPDQGSVGPHLDAYDVFLVQAQGHRRWRISTQPYDDADLIPDLDIRVLKHFEAEEEWLLAPGDVLYLPPGVAHWGIAEGDDCMTCSVGFRSPNQQELAADWFEHLLDKADDQRRYQDPARLTPNLGGEIPEQAFDQIRQLLETFKHWTDHDLTAWFGRYITEPKPHLLPEPPDCPLQDDELATGLADGLCLRAHPQARLAFVVSAEGKPQVFADGQQHAVANLTPGLRALCAHQIVSGTALTSADQSLLTALFNQGCIEWWDEDDDIHT